MSSDDFAPGATINGDGVRFALRSAHAERAFVGLFDAAGETETARVELTRLGGDLFGAQVPGVAAGTRYGFRADGPYDPAQGQWFDPSKLLMDPYAIRIDRPYRYDPALGAPRAGGHDTAALMPKAIVEALAAPVAPPPPVLKSGGFIYELHVRSFTMLHPDVPAEERGTVAALAHPAVIDHLKRLGVDAVELMPVTAWIDERHLGPLGLTNAWGYNPVSFMALDPRLAPGGIADLRKAVAALRQAGIGVILDLVFNHTGESDVFGPTLSLRGLDNLTYYRHHPCEPGRLVNDTGTGNTLACDRPAARDLVLDSLRHFVCQAGVDGFRFDLAPILGRTDQGFDPNAELLQAMLADPVLGDRVLIAEPWDIGPGGYQLGRFPAPFLEWNDRSRDDLRRFWRGDRSMVGALATRLAGSFDFFDGEPQTRSINFLAAHDGFTLADLTRYERKHNEANGEDNRDGHDENLSWNNGHEGEGGDDPELANRRRHDLRAMVATLFATRGTVMLTAGDEFGRTQHGNNNAYAQDNPAFWLDWSKRYTELETLVGRLAELRRQWPALASLDRLTGEPSTPGGMPDVEWLTEAGRPLTQDDWNDPDRHRLVMVLAQADGRRLAVAINGDRRRSMFSLPQRPGHAWAPVTGAVDNPLPAVLPGRTVEFFVETME
jgi:glycogen operon protein